MGDSDMLMGLLSLSSVFIYQANGHVLKYVGKQKWLNPFALTWILHVIVVTMAPQAFRKWPELLKELKKIKVPQYDNR